MVSSSVIFFVEGGWGWIGLAFIALSLVVYEYIELRDFHLQMLQVLKITKQIRKAMQYNRTLGLMDIPDNSVSVPAILNELSQWRRQ